jgi:hypothetical protein
VAKVNILELAKEAGAAARRRGQSIAHLRERWHVDAKLFEAVYEGWRSVEVEPPPRAPMNEAFQERLF